MACMQVRVCRGDDSIDGGGITDVDVFAVGRNCDAIRLAEGIVDNPDLACGGTESVTLGAELGGGVGQGVEP